MFQHTDSWIFLFKKIYSEKNKEQSIAGELRENAPQPRAASSSQHVVSFYTMVYILQFTVR